MSSIRNWNRSRQEWSIIDYAAIVTLPFSIYWSAFVVATLWKRFVVPLGVPALSAGAAYGLWLTWRFLCPDPATDPETPTKPPSYAVLAGTFRALLVLGFGWIAHHFS